MRHLADEIKGVRGKCPEALLIAFNKGAQCVFIFRILRSVPPPVEIQDDGDHRGKTVRLGEEGEKIMAGKFLAFQMKVPFGDHLLPVPSCIVSQDANRHPIVYSGLGLQAGQDDLGFADDFPCDILESLPEDQRSSL